MASHSRSPAALHDILYCIIFYLDPDPYDNTNWEEERSNRQALGRLATTHSTFTQPALSSLWRYLPDDIVLKKLLCAIGLAKGVPEHERSGKAFLELCGTPANHESGWKRFREYAFLVRKIVVYPSATVAVTVTTWSNWEPITLLHNTFWSQVASIVGDVPVLPRLSAIHFASPTAPHWFDLGALLLLNPHIQELFIKFDRVDVAHLIPLQTAFASCFSSTPNMERLSLQLLHPLLDLKALPESHRHLRYLRVDAEMNTSCLTSIASLPDLESLSICLSEPVNIPVQFKGLHSLSIFRCGLDVAATLITFVDAPCLRKVSIASVHPDSLNLRTELSQCLSPLVARFPSLTAFDWTCWQDSDSNYGYTGSTNPGVTLIELIEPLLPLRTLRDLSLDLHGPIVPYSSTDFSRMAEAWTHLEAFSLKLEHAYHSDEVHILERGHGPVLIQYANYETFASFARHCPRLHSLRIPRARIETVADVSPPPTSGTSETRTAHQLRHLVVDAVLCPEAPGWGATPQRNDAFTEMMKRVFPLACVCLPVGVVY